MSPIKAKQAVLTIADNGKGFDSTTRKPAGAGLGLTTTRSMGASWWNRRWTRAPA